MGAGGIQEIFVKRAGRGWSGPGLKAFLAILKSDEPY
jgi:hypothetical protein